MDRNDDQSRWGVGFDEIGPVGCGAWISFEDVTPKRRDTKTSPDKDAAKRKARSPA